MHRNPMTLNLPRNPFNVPLDPLSRSLQNWKERRRSLASYTHPLCRYDDAFVRFDAYKTVCINFLVRRSMYDPPV